MTSPVRGGAGLNVNPPGHTAVIPADRKTRIQALGRTRKPPPVKPGHPGTRTHDCRRSGTACLMAATDARLFRWSSKPKDLVEAWKKAAGSFRKRHREREFDH